MVGPILFGPCLLNGVVTAPPRAAIYGEAGARPVAAAWAIMLRIIGVDLTLRACMGAP